MLGGGEDRQRYRQIVTPAFFRQIGGRQIDGDAPGGKGETVVDQGTAYPIARLFHRGFRQTDQRQAGQAIADMHLHRHGRGLNADDGAAIDYRQ